MSGQGACSRLEDDQSVPDHHAPLGSEHGECHSPLCSVKSLLPATGLACALTVYVFVQLLRPHLVWIQRPAAQRSCCLRTAQTALSSLHLQARGTGCGRCCCSSLPPCCSTPADRRFLAAAGQPQQQESRAPAKAFKSRAPVRQAGAGSLPSARAEGTHFGLHSCQAPCLLASESCMHTGGLHARRAVGSAARLHLDGVPQGSHCGTQPQAWPAPGT